MNLQCKLFIGDLDEVNASHSTGQGTCQLLRGKLVQVNASHLSYTDNPVHAGTSQLPNEMSAVDSQPEARLSTYRTSQSLLLIQIEPNKYFSITEQQRMEFRMKPQAGIFSHDCRNWVTLTSLIGKSIE